LYTFRYQFLVCNLLLFILDLLDRLVHIALVMTQLGLVVGSSASYGPGATLIVGLVH
jgi:hypothetical protein